MNAPACMGGWCARRASCAHYRADDRREPAERLCSPSANDQWQAIDVAPINVKQAQEMTKYTPPKHGHVPVVLPAIAEIVTAAGAAGIDMEAIKAQAKERGICVRSVCGALQRLERLELIWRIKRGALLMCWPCTVPLVDAVKLHAKEHARRRAEAKAKRVEWNRASRARRTPEQREAERAKERQRYAKKADGAVKKRAPKAQTKPLEPPRNSRQISRATRAINRLAAKLERDSGQRQEPKAKPEPTIDWSRAVVTVAAPKVGRYEVLEAVGPFSSLRPGQYAFEAASCAARAAG